MNKRKIKYMDLYDDKKIHGDELARIISNKIFIQDNGYYNGVPMIRIWYHQYVSIEEEKAEEELDKKIMDLCNVV